MSRPSVILFVYVCTQWCASFAWSKTDTKPCLEMIKKKQYAAAGECFDKVAQSMGHGSKLSTFDKRTKGIYLLNGAKAFLKGVQDEKTPSTRAFYQERALQLYKRYLDEKLCLKKLRCQKIQATLYKISQEIGHATLTLVANQKAVVQLTGYKFEQQYTLPPNKSYRLRPGTYKLKAKIEGKPPISHTITLASNASTVESFTTTIPSPSAAPSKTLPVVLLISGVVVAGVGGALMLIATLPSQSLRTQYDEAEANAKANKEETPTTEMNRLRNELETSIAQGVPLYTAGIAALAVGSIATATGIITFFTSTPAKPTNAPLFPHHHLFHGSTLLHTSN